MSIDFDALEQKNRESIGSYDDELPDVVGGNDETAADTFSGDVTGLEALRRATDHAVSERKRFPVPAREGVVIEVETSIKARELREWTQVSRINKRRPADETNIDPVLLAARGIASKTTGIYLHEKKVIDETTGDPLTFLDEDVKGMYKVNAPWDAVVKMIGSDSGVQAVWAAVMREAGYADEAEALGN